ncbi:MAG: hypothetical protein IAE93_02235 [Ignavibacteria bacterium]|nr:hypothetical protein [Ignavibacteria bacterium]
MSNIHFLEELEKRLNELEAEISNGLPAGKNEFVMENLIHNFDEAMDRTTDLKPEMLEKHLKFMDY